MSSTPGSTTEDVYRIVRDRICRLELEPGTRLPEQALAQDLGVSRTPIRRVLDWLERDGLVTLSPGTGAVVSTVDLKQLREVWALRLKVAELVADFVHFPAPRDVADRLREVRDDLADVPASHPRALGEVYDRFHEIMLDVMDDGPLRRIHDQLYRQTSRVWVQLLPELDFETEIAAVEDEISLTIDAVTAASEQQLAEVRTKHLHMLYARLNEYLVLPFGAGR